MPRQLTGADERFTGLGAVTLARFMADVHLNAQAIDETATARLMAVAAHLSAAEIADVTAEVARRTALFAEQHSRSPRPRGRTTAHSAAIDSVAADVAAGRFP